MKKKIKDLTIEEFDKICDKYYIYNLYDYVECEKCPFYDKKCTIIRTFLDIKEKHNLEIEVDLSEKED